MDINKVLVLNKLSELKKKAEKIFDKNTKWHCCYDDYSALDVIKELRDYISKLN